MYRKIRKSLQFASAAGLIITGFTAFTPKSIAMPCYCLVRSGAISGPCTCQLQWSGNYDNCDAPCIGANYSGAVLAVTCGPQGLQKCQAALNELACQPQDTCSTSQQKRSKENKGRENRSQEKNVRK